MKKTGAIMALIGAIGTAGTVGYMECYGKVSLWICVVKLAIYALTFTVGMAIGESNGR